MLTTGILKRKCVLQVIENVKEKNRKVDKG